jgi:hypothetical protein
MFAVFACGKGSSEAPGDSPDGGASSPPDGGAETVGDGATTPPGPTGPLDPAAAARAAIFVATCISDDGADRTLQEFYLDKNASPFYSRSVLDCLSAKTNGCQAVTDCMGMKTSTDGPCDGGCVGNVYQECEAPNYRITVDCSTLGLQCKPQQGAYCGTAASQPCDPATYLGSCDDGTPVNCAEGITVRGPRCPDLGLSCTEVTTRGSGKLFGCQGTGDLCASAGDDGTTTATFEGLGCAGNVLQACVNSRRATLDCTTVATGFTCFPSPDAGENALGYCGVAAECTPRSAWDKVTAACDGTSVVLCNGGKIGKVDCVSLGFTGCKNGLCTPAFP